MSSNKCSFTQYRDEGSSHHSRVKPSSRRKPADGAVMATVKFFDNTRGYGFIQCETTPPTDAFLSIKELHKSGYLSVEKGRILDVKLQKTNRQPLAYDVYVRKSTEDNHFNAEFMKKEKKFKRTDKENLNLVDKMKSDLKRKENLLRTLDTSKLPDKGFKLNVQIKNLQERVKGIRTETQPRMKTAEENRMTARQKVQLEFDEALKALNINDSIRNKKEQKTSKKKQVPAEEKVTYKAIQKLHELLKTCPDPTSEVADPPNLLVKLMKHQSQALCWLSWRESQVDCRGGILADDMGLGKTITMIALILHQKPLLDKIFQHSNKIEPSLKEDQRTLLNTDATLVVAPASVIYQWSSEIDKRCSPGALVVHVYHGSKREKRAKRLVDFDVVITTYDLVRNAYFSDGKKTNSENCLFEINWRRVILDEAHEIKNTSTKKSLAVCALKSRVRWAVTGTPIQNNIGDLFAMLKFLNCHPFNNHDLWMKEIATGDITGNQKIKTLVSCFILQRTKEQKDIDGKALIELPERVFKLHEITLGEVELKVYTKLLVAYKNIIKKSLSGNGKTNMIGVLTILLRLRQCCCHLHLLTNVIEPSILEEESSSVFSIEDCFNLLSLKDKDAAIEDLTRKSCDLNSKYFEKSFLSSKVKLLAELLKDICANGEKCVVVSQWTSFLDIVHCYLNQEVISHETICGKMSSSKRLQTVTTFNNDPTRLQVLLVSLKAGGVGLNLIGANHLVMIDMHWNPALEKQACDRIYRVGQQKDVYIHKFIVKNTIEESILKLQNRKLKEAHDCMEGARTENKKKTALSLDDIKYIFNL